MANQIFIFRFIVAVVFVSLLAFSGFAAADDNPFKSSDLDSGYMLAGTESGEEGSCGEGDSGEEGSCGEGDSGEEGSCGEGDSGEEGSCGEGDSGEGGSCGEDDSGEEGSCGEGQ
jgi:uncharacterized low-complexity protein